MKNQKSQHTPGPWTYETARLTGRRMAGQPESIDRFVIGTPRNDRGGRFVTAVIDGPFCERERHEADARLIAAAPELLEAARLLFREYGGAGICPANLDLLRAAIAKAEGK